MDYSGIERTVCQTEVTTSKKENGWMDVDLTIEFKDGPLKGKKFCICIDIDTGKRIW